VLYSLRGRGQLLILVTHTLRVWSHEIVASLVLGRVHTSDIAHGHRLVECIERERETKQEVVMATGPDW